jgi:hypothetical protein
MILYFTLFVFLSLGFLLDKKEGVSNFIIFSFILFILFLSVVHVYYVKPESLPEAPEAKEVKRIRTTKKLEEALDAVLNKNTSSAE